MDVSRLIDGLNDKQRQSVNDQFDELIETLNDIIEN